MHPYQPQKIVVDSEVLQLPFTTRVLAKFPKIQPLIVSRQEYLLQEKRNFQFHTPKLLIPNFLNFTLMAFVNIFYKKN